MQSLVHPLVESANLKEIKTTLKRPRAQNDIQVFSGSQSFSDGQAVHTAEVGFSTSAGQHAQVGQLCCMHPLRRSHRM